MEIAALQVPWTTLVCLQLVVRDSQELLPGGGSHGQAFSKPIVSLNYTQAGHEHQGVSRSFFQVTERSTLSGLCEEEDFPSLVE